MVSAPSGAGKTSLLAALMKRSANLAVSISHTTRARRGNEENGVNYHFVDVPTFSRMVSDGAFLEHADVFGNYYGTALSSVEGPLAAGTDLILEIDWQGAQQVRRLIPAAIGIFILPPDRATLEQRLRSRGEDRDDVIRQRLSKAVEEMSHCTEYDYLVVNDDFERATNDLIAIVRAERLKRAPQAAALGPRLSALLDTSSAA